MVTDAGVLDTRILLEQRVETVDPRFNSRQVSWVPLAKVWAKRVESSAAPSTNPGERAGVDAYARPTKYRIRFRRDVDKTQVRVNAGGRILRIAGTAEIGRRQWLELACDEWSHEQQ